MLFTTPSFAVLVLSTFIMYYLPFFKKYQVGILLLSSCIFYAYNEPYLLALLLLSLLINSSISYLICFRNTSHKKLIATIGVSLNLLLICLFKYSPLLVSSLSGEDTSIGKFLISIPLPIGISFFTFEGISLLVDTYKNKGKNTVLSIKFSEHLKNVSLFVVFFPHLVAGPILKAQDFIPQIKPKLFSTIEWEKIVRLLITGYFLKMVIADNLKEQTMYMTYPNFLTTPSYTLIIMIFGYSIQIFADFAGYSLIAIGLALLFGYTFPINFNYPYISRSFSEFWRRWHISLSTFLRDYLYIPLGGNRMGGFRTCFNLMAVMFIGGLWHGAAWSFAIWGAVHGLALVTERLIKPYFEVKRTFLLNALRMAGVFFFVSTAWLLFKLQEFSQVMAYFNAIHNNMDIDMTNFWQRMIIYILIYSLPVLIYHLYYLARTELRYKGLEKVEFAAYGTMLFLIITNSGVPGDFIYFQF